MGRLIDADKIHPDVRTKRGGLAISQGQLAYAPTVEAIPKDQYEQRLKVDMVAMLTEIQLEIEGLDVSDVVPEYQDGAEETKEYIANMIEQKINALRGNENDKTTDNQ